MKVVAEPRRREILRLIWDAELPATSIAERFDITFGAVSQHLKILRDAGLVTMRREGTRRIYQADQRALAPYVAILERMWGRQLDRLTELAEAEAQAAPQPTAEQLMAEQQPTTLEDKA